MNDAGPWHTEDYEKISWHDCHVHGWRFDSFNDREGAAELVLDIDYIMKWERAGDGFQFTVCRAELMFHDAFRLKFSLDYATPTAGMTPFMIRDITREQIQAPNGHQSFRWHVHINWPEGFMEFEAPGFTQRLVGTPHVQPNQALSPEQRRGANAA